MRVSDLEGMEERLKADILAESVKFEGNVLLHDEISDQVCAHNSFTLNLNKGLNFVDILI